MRSWQMASPTPVCTISTSLSPIRPRMALMPFRMTLVLPESRERKFELSTGKAKVIAIGRFI